MSPTRRKSWTGNLLMWSDFMLGSSFKVKRWLIGLCEFSFWWIQFASVLRCARSSYFWNTRLIFIVVNPNPTFANIWSNNPCSLQRMDMVCWCFTFQAASHIEAMSMSWCDLDLTFDLAIVTLGLKICPGYISDIVRCRKLILGTYKIFSLKLILC